MKVRTYQNINDLQAMLNLIAHGRQAKNNTHYIHVGDLQWWLFYNYTPQEILQSNIRLWMKDDELIGWALLSFDEKSFDVYMSPQYSYTKYEEEILASTIQEMDVAELQAPWIADNDTWRINWLEKNGFEKGEHFYYHMHRFLSSPITDSAPPTGFSLRHSRGIEDVEVRSVCSAAAFESSKPFDEYVVRTKNFMQSSAYVPEHELFVMSPENQVASFCIIWKDELNKIGHFEPVGTHPNFQGKGLGKNLLHEGLRKLRREGMREASVCVDFDNPNAIRLYESVGFQKSKKLLTYKKRK